MNYHKKASSSYRSVFGEILNYEITRLRKIKLLDQYPFPIGHEMCRCCVAIEVLVKIEIYMMVQQIRYKIDHGSLILQAINDTTMRVHDKYRKTIDIRPDFTHLHDNRAAISQLLSLFHYSRYWKLSHAHKYLQPARIQLSFVSKQHLTLYQV